MQNKKPTYVIGDMLLQQLTNFQITSDCRLKLLFITLNEVMNGKTNCGKTPQGLGTNKQGCYHKNFCQKTSRDCLTLNERICRRET